jgi:ABC-type transport system substrate-binding protein
MVGPGEADRLREDPDFQVLDRGLTGWTLFFWLNQNPRVPWAKEHPQRLALFQQLEFRQALARVIDREEIIRQAFKGYAAPCYGPVSPIYQWVADNETLKDLTPPRPTARLRLWSSLSLASLRASQARAANTG